MRDFNAGFYEGDRQRQRLVLRSHLLETPLKTTFITLQDTALVTAVIVEKNVDQGRDVYLPARPSFWSDIISLSWPPDISEILFDLTAMV